MRKLNRVLMLICLAVFVFSLVKLIGIRLEYKQEEDFYEKEKQEKDD